MKPLSHNLRGVYILKDYDIGEKLKIWDSIISLLDINKIIKGGIKW
jgi:hypothetical protein